MNTTEMPLNLLDGTVIPGTKPIIILGPNGSGKTRYARQLSNSNNADFIAALRNIQLPANVSMQSLVQASESLRNNLNSFRNQPWVLSSEIDTLFSKLMAEDAASAVEFRDKSATGGATQAPPVTKLMRLNLMWSALFPGRKLTFAGYVPKVQSDLSSDTAEYSAERMSDGERVALYHAGRVLDAAPGLIFVDEPEVHFHSRLAARFWDEVQLLRPDCRFVFITHDLSFARSRRTDQFVVVRPSNSTEVITLERSIPDDVAESILAAATISIHAKRIIFTEGTESSYDEQFFAAWFNDKSIAVVPVGSCRDVIRCTTTFRDKQLVAGVACDGLIDSDYWPESFLSSLPAGVTALPVHEVESLFCLQGVFGAIADHFGRSSTECTDYYREFVSEIRKHFVGGLLAKQISERFRARCEHQVRSVLNTLHIDPDLATSRKLHTEAVAPDKWTVQPDQIFDEERSTLEKALQGSPDEILRYFPGKITLPRLAAKLGMTEESYTRIIFDALRAPSDSKLYGLGQKLRKNLETKLPK